MCVSEQLFQWVRAHIPLILKIFSLIISYIQIHVDLKMCVNVHDDLWWISSHLNLFWIHVVFFFPWFCWIVFEYVIFIFLNKPNIRLKPDVLWTSWQLPTILQNPPQFRCLESSVAPHQPSNIFQLRCNSLTGTCLSSSRNWWPRHWDFWWFLVFRLRHGTERKRNKYCMSHKPYNIHHIV